MSKSKRSAKPVATEEPQVAAEPAQPAAVVATVEPKQAKIEMRGKSTVESPVALVWVISHNAMLVAQRDGKERPSRKALFDLCRQAGIAPYTARTQIQLYLKASANGTQAPVKHPKNINFGE